MSDDMSEIINKLSSMINNNEIPDDLKNIMNKMSDSSNNSNTSSDSSSIHINNSELDVNSILKMKKIIDSMNSPQNDPRANLLRSLKPYLKNSRKEKVEQYIKIFNMSKAFDIINTIGGDKKNDV